MKHQKLNKLIGDNAYTSYLEIGYGNGANFNMVECENKVAIDPDLPETIVGKQRIFSMGADDFFNGSKEKFDLIFIDGDHRCEQTEMDIVNSWGALNQGGMIVLHDIAPYTEEMQIVPRIQAQWTGDVWRAWKGFVDKYGTKIDTGILEDKYGLGVIYKNRCKVALGFVDRTTTYQEYVNEEPDQMLL